MTSFLDFDTNMNDLSVSDEKEGDINISDGSGLRGFGERALIYNENWAREIDTTSEWTLTGAGTATVSTGVLTMTADTNLLNKSLALDISNKRKKFIIEARIRYTVQNQITTLIGLGALSGNYLLGFLKATANNDNWTGYLIDENSHETETEAFSISRNIWHRLKIVCNYQRMDFFVDDIFKGKIVFNASTNPDISIRIINTNDNGLDFDFIRITEVDLPQ